MGFGEELALTFVPLLVAIDAVGVLPFILSLTPKMTPNGANQNCALCYAHCFGVGAMFYWHWDWRL